MKFYTVDSEIPLPYHNSNTRMLSPGLFIGKTC